jgi:(E)-4-hydroxy-3-methylbut-2-enyl-diphosphate synthase
MAIEIHFRAPEGFTAGAGLTRLASFLLKRGVSRLWLDFEQGHARETTGPHALRETVEIAAAAGLTTGVAASPKRAGALEGPHDVLIEAPCVDSRMGRGRGKIEELGRVRDALLGRGAREVFLRLVHAGPVLGFNYGRLLKERLGAPLVVSLDGADGILDALSAGPLLAEGLADAVLVLPGPSAAAPDLPEFESLAGRLIERAKRILSMLGLHPKGYELISCPTCGRCGLDVEGMARETDTRMRALVEELRGAGKDLERVGGITVAVMGCNVNGPGEASAADIGIAGGKNGRGALFIRGVPVRTLPEGELVRALMDGVRAIIEERFGSTGETGAETRSGGPAI